MVQVPSEEEIKCRQDDDKFKQNPSKELLLFDDEVASLLLDMRERLPTPQNLQYPKEELCDSSVKEEIPSRKRKFRGYSEEECDTIEEPPEDDDEWMEGRSDYFSQTLISKTIRKKAPSGSACEKHKRWKKRCPDDCPMRKAKTRKEPNTNYFEMIQWSLIELKEDSEQEEMDEEEEEETVEEEEEEEFQEKKKKRKDENEKERKSRRNIRSKRSGRKYLPQACERHKILHAKCPANCPDRIRRDAEAARQQRLQPLGSSSSSEDLLNEMALP